LLSTLVLCLCCTSLLCKPCKRRTSKSVCLLSTLFLRLRCTLNLQGKAMTCMFCTADSRCVWTGHADGTIMLHADGNWRVAHYSTQVCLLCCRGCLAVLLVGN
jgi:hypothetical protein